MAEHDPTADMLIRLQAVELILTHFMASYAASQPAPEKALSEIAERVNRMIDGFRPPPSAEVAALVDLTRQSVDSLLTQARVGLLQSKTGGS